MYIRNVSELIPGFNSIISDENIGKIDQRECFNQIEHEIISKNLYQYDGIISDKEKYDYHQNKINYYTKLLEKGIW